MEQVTTYSARKSNVFVWIAVLCMAVSAAARIIWLFNAHQRGVLFAVLGVLFPLLANLLIGLRLPIRGEKYFYVTIRPVICIQLYFVYRVSRVSVNVPRAGWPLVFVLLCALLCIAQALMYYLTFTGRLASSVWVLLIFLLPAVAAALDPAFRAAVPSALKCTEYVVISDLALVTGELCAILSAKKLPPPKEGDPYRFRYGDRMDGRLVRGGEPLDKVAPYIMPDRNGSNNLIKDSIDAVELEHYIHRKRREGLKHFGITHVLIASYVRASASYPGIMRFLAGQKVYQRMHVTLKMAIKKDLKLNSPETIISVDFYPSDTIEDIYRKFSEQLYEAQKTEDLDSSFDKFDQICVVSICSCAFGNLKNKRSTKFAGRFCDTLHDLHVVHVERTDGIAAVVGLFEHFSCGYQRHSHTLLLFFMVFLLYHRISQLQEAFQPFRSSRYRSPCFTKSVFFRYFSCFSPMFLNSKAVYSSSSLG